MIKNFIADYAKLIVNYPDDAKVEQTSFDDFEEIVIYTHKNDVGLLIGKDGNMINAIKTLITGCKAKDSKSYRVNIEANG